MPKKPNALYRCDLLPHVMNQAKEGKVRDLFHAWRQVAVLHGREQWRIFFEAGGFNKLLQAGTGKKVLPAAACQMVRHQVVGVLESFLANRQNEFTDLVNRSSVSPEIKHQLHFINRWSVWFTREPLVVKGVEIAPEIRALARSIMRHVLSHHCRPDLSRLNMVIDQRMVKISRAMGAKTFPLWLRFSTLEKGCPIWVPLKSYSHFESRGGELAKTVQVNLDRDGNITFGLLTDVSETLKESHKDYRPVRDAIALDLGLSTLFATDEGDLLGRNWIEKLKDYDRRISKLAAYRQSRGLKARSPRYNRYVAGLRGFIRSEVSRILNCLVEAKKPARLIVERLDFRNPNLSRRMNRLLTWFGKKAIDTKLKDLAERFGIEVEEVNPAYSSQECRSCHYVDKRNRPRQSAFDCLWCGSLRHADVNAARVLRGRRSSPELSHPRRHRTDILAELVRRFGERHARARGGPADPRLSNPYFKDWTAEVMLTGRGWYQP